MHWQVPLFDPDLGIAEIDALKAVIESGWLAQGERTAEFERAFSTMLDSPEGIAVNNCTAALHLALTALGIGEGDEVVCPSLTFVATANAIRYCGARPVFADVVSLDDWNIDRASIEAVLTPRTKAVVVVHYAGYMCDMQSIMSLARERNLKVVEDVAHAPGAVRNGKAAGAWGDVGCFSFFPNKNMTTGEGGMVTTANVEVADRIRLLRSHAMTSVTLDRHKGHAFSYDVMELGFNYRMSELNAALGLAQLRRLVNGNAKRREHVTYYRENLARITELTVPFLNAPGEPVCHIMPVLLSAHVDRTGVISKLREKGIQTSIHYRPVDTFTAYQDAKLGPCDYLYNTHVIGGRVLTLPLFPSMTQVQIDLVCSSLQQALCA